MPDESVMRYRSILRMFLTFLKEKNVRADRIDAHILRDFLRYLKFDGGAKHKTIENCFSAISAFYDYLVFEGLTGKNLCFHGGVDNQCILSFGTPNKVGMGVRHRIDMFAGDKTGLF